MAETDYAVVLFHSTQGAMKAERVLLLAGFTVKLIPTPRQFSSNCGTALRCPWSDASAVRAALKSNGVEFQSIRKLTVRQ
jgi:hypothetical protein